MRTKEKCFFSDKTKTYEEVTAGRDNIFPKSG